MTKAAKTRKKVKGEWDEGLSALNRNAAGIDVGIPIIMLRFPMGEIPSQCEGSEASRRTCIAWRNG